MDYSDGFYNGVVQVKNPNSKMGLFQKRICILLHCYTMKYIYIFIFIII